MIMFFDVIFLVFLIIGFGYLVVWWKMFFEVGVDGLMCFV